MKEMLCKLENMYNPSFPLLVLRPLFSLYTQLNCGQPAQIRLQLRKWGDLNKCTERFACLEALPPSFVEDDSQHLHWDCLLQLKILYFPTFAVPQQGRVKHMWQSWGDLPVLAALCIWLCNRQVWILPKR